MVLKPLLYKDLANKLVALSRAAPFETLERVSTVELTLKQQSLDIIAMVTGRDLVALGKLREVSLLRQHLKNTVTTKEISKQNR